MGKAKLIIEFEGLGCVEGELYSELNPETFEALIRSLPIESTVETWGKEVYFEVPVSVGRENAKREVSIGDIAYWPDGGCLCIFFGPTPISVDEKPIAASPVNVVGRVISGLDILSRVEDGVKVKVKLASN
jgi:hypothetical protein